VPVQLLLVLSALRGFAQEWNVEVEVSPSGSPIHTDPPSRGPEPAGV